MVHDDEDSREPWLESGSRVGDWEVVERIGQGGTTTVYRARNGEDVAALKVCHSRDPAARDRFRIGAKTAHMLTTEGATGVVPTFAFGEWNDQPYVVEELLERSLVDDDVGPDPESSEDPTRRRVEWIVELGIQLADRLADLHDNGVLHRDVKLDNILLRDNGEPVLTDFDLSKDELRHTLTAQGEFVGTPNYASPEQATGGWLGIGPATDAWSLGVSLYTLLCDHHPFGGETLKELTNQIMFEQPKPLHRRASNVSKSLSAVVERCLQKSPEDRYTSARAVADDLRRVAAGQPSFALRASRRKRLQLFLRVNRVPAVVVSLGLVTFFVVKTLLDAADLRERLAPAAELQFVPLGEPEPFEAEYSFAPVESVNPADAFPEYEVLGTSGIVPIDKPVSVRFERDGERVLARLLVPDVLDNVVPGQRSPAERSENYDRLLIPPRLPADVGVPIPELGFRVLGFADGGDLRHLKDHLRAGDRKLDTWTQVATFRLSPGPNGQLQARVRTYRDDEIDFECMSQVMAFHIATAAGGFLPTDRELETLRAYLAEMPGEERARRGLEEFHEYFVSDETRLVTASRHLLGQVGLGARFWGPEAANISASDSASSQAPLRVLVIALLASE